MNLIPEKNILTASYCVTWALQSVAAEKLGITGTNQSQERDALTQETLLDTDEFYHPIPREYRSGMFFLLDDGWDVPLGTINDAAHGGLFGACEPDPVKFSRCGNTALERLIYLRKAMEERGYAGLGLWISPQQKNETKYDPEAARAYWEDRARLCHEAGVRYWKVDWGYHAGDNDYRRMLVESARKYAPDLIVENGICEPPFTGLAEEGFPERRAREAREQQMTFSDVYRTYDIVPPFMNVCTLQRAWEALEDPLPEVIPCKAYVNGEFVFPICAALGLTSGIMINIPETIAMLRWQRIAPPFGAREAKAVASEERLTDTVSFREDLYGWVKCGGKTLSESAPAIIARGCALPRITPVGRDVPFAVAARNPATGALSLAAFARAVGLDAYETPAADVRAEHVSLAPIGIFGDWHSVTIDCTVPAGTRIMAQDMLSDEAEDVTDEVLTPDGLFLNADILARFAGEAHAMVLGFVKED